jgi:hypothetical protein
MVSWQRRAAVPARPTDVGHGVARGPRMNICTDRNTSVISAFMPFASRVGAQARAVMVRALSLRVNRRRQRLRVLRKDVNVGPVNGIAVVAPTLTRVCVPYPS